MLAPDLLKLISGLIERNTQADSERGEWSELMTSSAPPLPLSHWTTSSHLDPTGLSLGAVISRKTLDTQTA